MTQKQSAKPDAEELEKLLRGAIDSYAPLKSAPEELYCEVVLDALDLVRAGVACRQEELLFDEDDDDEGSSEGE